MCMMPAALSASCAACISTNHARKCDSLTRATDPTNTQLQAIVDHVHETGSVKYVWFDVS